MWECDGKEPGSFLPARTAAAEVAGCLRDLVAALRTLPRLSLAIAPLAQVRPVPVRSVIESPRVATHWARRANTRQEAAQFCA